MPTSSGPNQTGEENLVFAYDTGDVSNSYKGEPATNLITSGLPGYFGSGGQTFYQERLYGFKSDSGIFQRNYVTNPATADTSAFNNNAGLYKNFTTAALSSNTEYVLVSFDFYMITPYVRYNNSSTGLNGYMGILYTDSSTGNHGWNTSLNTPNAGDDWNNNSAYIGQWRKIALYIDLTDAKTPASISSMYIYNDKTVTGQGIFTNFIITEHTTLPTSPKVYTSGTRSSTTSLIDLKRTTDIDVSNVSFDSTGQPTFDGTDDYVEIGGYFNYDNATLSMWIRPDSVSNITIPISKNTLSSPHLYGYIQYYNNQLRFYAPGNNLTVNWGTISTANWYNIVLTVNGSLHVAYKNGVQISSQASNLPLFTGDYNVQLGRYGTGSPYIYQGLINSLRIYNRALTAQEVKQNYQQYKTRFNLS